ncbi:helix-turn-helix domain-containing protein [Enterococcus sp. LJL98]
MNHTPEWLKKIIRIPDMQTSIKIFGGHKQTVSQGWKAARETHLAFELMFILSGVQQTELSGMTYEFNTNDMILIAPGIPHENQCISKEELTYFCIHFDIDDPVVQQKLLMYCPLLLRKENPSYANLEKIIQDYLMILAMKKFEIKDRLRVQQLVIELVIQLLEYADYEQVEVKSSDNLTLILATEIAEALQANLRQFMKDPKEENLDLLSLHRIAESFNISESRMLKVFKKVYAVSPKYYLDQLRYNESRYLLHQPSLSIGEISEVIGYQNASHFSRQFKRWNGQSPKEYRQNKKE